MRHFLTLLALVTALVFGLAGAPARANPYAPEILVNDLGITGYEIGQRMRFMQLLGGSGDLRAAAEEALIEDRLRIWQARADGIALSPEALAQGMAEFASRANLSTEEFLKALAQEGVDAQTYRDFVTAGMLWREVVRAHFAGRVQISEAEITRALAVESVQAGPPGMKVLLSEIVVPVKTGQEAAAMALARRASGLRSEAAFADLAREISAAPTADKGGRLDWMSPDALPPELRDVVLGLRPGQTTAPVQMPNALAVFFLRGFDDGGPLSAANLGLGYATLLLGASGAPETAALAARVSENAKNCDDLYTAAKGLPAERLERIEPGVQGGPPSDLAAVLAKLDPGETQTLRRGGNDLLVMLCSRGRRLNEALGETGPSRSAMREQLLNARLGSYADGMMADLMADAVIVRK